MKKISELELSQLENSVEEVIKNNDLLKEKQHQDTITTILRYLEEGALRVASPQNSSANCGIVPMNDDLQNWQVNTWVKQAILFALRMRVAQTFETQLTTPENNIDDLQKNGRIYAGKISYHDKFDIRTNLAACGVRALPGSNVREGVYVSKNVILMPSYVNIGAWIGEGTMIDTWATAGSCAQIGINVHVAGGVGIGGVLEPANARPVIVGDNVFLGSRVILVEGVVVGGGAVLGANVTLTSSTPIYDVTTPEKREYRGYVPQNAVLVMGTRPKQFPGGEVQLQCAYIIAYRDARIDAKISLNHILRETGITV